MPLITKVLKPERFTAQQMAEIYAGKRGVDLWKMRPEARQLQIDMLQDVLDGLVALGILG